MLAQVSFLRRRVDQACSSRREWQVKCLRQLPRETPDLSRATFIIARQISLRALIATILTTSPYTSRVFLMRSLTAFMLGPNNASYGGRASHEIRC